MRKIWLVIFALAIFLMLREGGYINFQYSTGKFNDQMQTDLYSKFYEYEGDKQQLIAERKTGNYESDVNENSWKLGFQTTSQTNIFTDFKKQLQKHLESSERVSMDVHKVELSGLYWFPLYKVGSCKYSFDVEIVGAKSRIYRGTVQGKIDFAVSGISSVNEVKKELSMQIAKILSENVQKEIKKQ